MRVLVTTAQAQRKTILEGPTLGCMLCRKKEGEKSIRTANI